MGVEFLFMVDNARPHRANIVDECLQSEDIAHTASRNGIDFRTSIRKYSEAQFAAFWIDKTPAMMPATVVYSSQTSVPSKELATKAWRVVGRLEGGQTQAEVAQAIGVSQSVISRISNRFLGSESAGRRPGQGRRRATKPNEDRYLVLTLRRYRNMNATFLQQHLRSATVTTVSTQTVRNQMHGIGLYAHRPLSHFSVLSDNRRIFNWRDCRSRNNSAFVHESVRFGGGGVLVYGCISIDGRKDLYIIRDGPLTARRYKDEILRPIVVPYAAAIGDDFILMDDNSRPHHADLVENSLFEKGIVRMEWPECSPNMNPIEHVWDALGRRVAGRQPPPQTLQELERALLEEWDRIPQLVINPPSG
ncbi:transposable element Tcb2 transposase [Trichonephila clavipes]|nr:transposable element Tcb2 transposase [Trichonephila clavipes]